MSINYGDVGTLKQYLQLLQTPEQIEFAEQWLSEFKKDVRCFSDLLAVMSEDSDGQNDTLRFQAANQLTKVTKHFKHLGADEQAFVQQKLIERLGAEQHKPTLTAICASIARVYKSLLKQQKDWNAEIFQLIAHLAQDENPKHRALNFELIEHLSEQAPAIMMSQVAQFCQLFAAGCQDVDAGVQVSCFHAITLMVEQFNQHPEDASVLAVKDVLPFVLQACATFLQSKDEDHVVDGLEVFSVCSASHHDVCNDSIGQLLPFLLDIVTAGTDVIEEIGTRNSAGETFRQLIINRPKLIGKLNLVQPCLAKLVQTLAIIPGSSVGAIFNFNASISDKTDDDDDDEDPTVATARMIQECIDSMAIHIPKKYFVEPALQLVHECLNNENPDCRKAGCAVLGVITEGTRETIRHMLDQILPVALERCKDPDSNVRECACFALGQMAEHCQPQILLYHDTIIPAILENFDPANPIAVQITSAYVIETFCEPLQPVTLEKYLGHILGKLEALLTSDNLGLVETALSALASVSVASESKFLPYMGAVITFLSPFMQREEETHYNVRGRALECLGHIAIAVGTDHYEPYFIPSLQNAVAVLNSTDEKVDGLKEYSYIFIANTAKAMKKKYTPLLDQLVPLLVKAASEEESEPYESGGDEEDETVLVTVHDGFIANKKASLTALGALAEYTGGDFFPHLQSYINLLFEDEGPLDSFHEVIRAEALSVLVQCVAVVTDKEMSEFMPKKGEVGELPPNVSTIATQIIGKYIHVIANDKDRQTVHAAIQGLEETIKRLGASCLCYPGIGIDVMTQGITAVLANSLPCQKAIEQNDDDSDHDNIVMDAVCDLIGTIVKQMGENFLPYFESIHKHLQVYLSRADADDRAMAIGCYGEVIEEAGLASAPYFQFIFEAISSGTTDGHEGVRRNSAYCIAAGVESLGANFTAENFNAFLQLLAPLCTRADRKDREDTRGGDVDNAIAAVFRIAKKFPEHVPLEHFLPPILNSLPVQADPLEGQKIYETLFQYIAAKEPNTLANLPLVLTVFAKVLLPDSIDSGESQQYVQETFNMAYGSPEFQQTFDAAFEQIDKTYADALRGSRA